MKKLLLILAIVVCVDTSLAQMTSHITGALPAYQGMNAGTKIPYLLYTPLEVRNGEDEPDEKFPVIIALHGIGERTDGFTSLAAITTAELSELYVNGIPTLLQTSTSALSGKKFKAPGRPDSEAQEFYVYAPQCYGGYSWFYPIYGRGMLDEIKKNPKADLSRIYVIGLSFGAGGALTWMQIRDLSDEIAGIVAVSAGYSRFNWNNPITSDYQNFADWGGIAILAHSVNDDVTGRKASGSPLDIYTNPGSWHTDRAFDSITNRYKGKTHVIYHRWTTGAHNGVWYWLFHPNNFTVVRSLMNGETRATGSVNNMYAILLSRRNVKRRTD